MLKPYFSTLNPPHNSVLAEPNPDGNWIVVDADRERIVSDVAFRQMFQPKPRNGFQFYRSPNNFGLDLHQSIEDGSSAVQLLRSKEEVKIHYAKFGKALYIDKHGAVFQFKDFPLGWVGWVNPGEDLMSEDNELWALPLIAVIDLCSGDSEPAKND